MQCCPLQILETNENQAAMDYPFLYDQIELDYLSHAKVKLPEITYLE